MKVLLTGGSGDLANVVVERGKADTYVRFDVRPPNKKSGEFIQGSINDRDALLAAMQDVDCVVHIAGWHGLHESRKLKNAYDFWDLNMTGTFNVFQAAVDHGINNIIYISSEAIADQYGLYGQTKVLGEQVAETYAHRHDMGVITLRPRAFVPHWNKRVYNDFIEWTEWFLKGAVHIDDVADSVLKSIEYLQAHSGKCHYILPVDGAYEYSEEDLLHWDADGAGSSFNKYYAEYADLVAQHGIDVTVKPSIQDISETKKILGYEPQYSVASLLQELKQYGAEGPNEL